MLGSLDGGGDAAGKVDVIVFDEHHVEEADAMVGTAADFHGLLLEQTHAGGSLAGIEYLGLETVKALLVAGGGGGDTAHALHDIEHGALGLEQRTHRALDHKGHVAGLYAGAVAYHHGHVQLGVKLLKHAPGYVDTGQYAFFLYYQLLTAAGLGGDGAESGGVAVAHILGKGQGEQVVDELVGSFHCLRVCTYMVQR